MSKMHVLKGQCAGCGAVASRAEPTNVMGYSSWCSTCQEHSLHFGINAKQPTPPPREPEDRYARPKDCRCGGLTEPCTPCLEFHRPSESEKCAGCACEDCVFPVVYSDAKPWPREPERKGTTRDCGHNYKFITDKGCSVCGPDPRDEALRLAEETLVRASRYWNSVPRFIEEALAAIRSIRKP